MMEQAILQPKHLGTFSGRIAVFGGPYSNLQATQALKTKLEASGFTASEIICTGDIVAYCGQPAETLGLIRDWGIHCIQGNVEVQLSSDAGECGCNFVNGSLCESLAEEWYEFANTQLSDQDKKWMGALPQQLSFQFGGLRFRVVHGDVRDISRFIFNSTAKHIKEENFSAGDCDAILCGHSGLAFTNVFSDSLLWCNAGVIGMPANDGTARVWYTTLEINGSQLHIEHHNLSYDHRLASDEMRRHKLPLPYAETLLNGRWPCMAILPDIEKSLCGIPISLPRLSVPIR